MAMLKMIKPYVTREQLGYVGNSVINSIILYAAPIWAHTTDDNLNRLQKAQIKVARMIIWNPVNSRTIAKEHRQTILTDLKWLNVRQLATSSILNLVRQGASNQSSKGINSLFIRNPRMNQRICNSHKIIIPSNTKRTGKNLLDTGVPLFNTLPFTLRDSKKNKFSYKRSVKSYVCDLHHLTEN